MAQDNTPFSLQGMAYADAKVEFNGIELPGVKSFDFSERQEKVNNPGTGKNPVSRSRKGTEQNASMELDLGTIEKLEDISPTGKLIDVPAGTLVISVARDDGTKKMYTFNLFEWMEDGLSGSTGDDELLRSTDCIFGTWSKTTL